MKALTTAVATLLLVALSSARPEGGDEEDPSARQVRDLVSGMQQGSYPRGALKVLRRSHIPHLLAHAGDDRPVKKFPANPLTSQSQASCTTGMIVLWLVEGLRKGEDGRFMCPSLNPLCFKEGDTAKGKNWDRESTANLPAARAAYGTWWKRYLRSTDERDLARDPLDGTGLHWY